ncbi:MAG: ArsA-related P-loop ATPase [Acidimicrobiia bacterium]
MATSELVLVSGKGGTGKSALTAALAIEQARRGRRVLAVDLGSGLGLGAHLRVTALDYRPVQVRPGLWAMTMVRAAALDEYLKTQLRVPHGAPTGAVTAALNVLVDTAPGVREIISIGKPIFELWKHEWDAVLVDTPSLGQFQSYLRAPETIAAIVPTGNVQRQAAELATTLADRDTTRVVLVTTPAELPVIETMEAIATIRNEGLCPPPTVVVNRLVTTMSISDDAIATLPEGPFRDAAIHQRSVERLQEHWLEMLDYQATLPYLMGVLTPGEVALRLADSLEML